VCLINSYVCGVVNHDRGKLAVNESVLLIMAPANKANKFVAYRDPPLPISKRNQAQYEILVQEMHEVAH
jgi:hypothetical protein